MAYTDIDKPTDYFETKLYTGNGGTQSITGLDFQPNWVWIKRRNGAESHALFDSVRGVQKQLASDATGVEETVSTSLTAFGSDGFTVGAYSRVNASSDTFVSWNWKAGGSSSTNTDGNLDTTVSVNATAGFSIVKYVGEQSATQTFGHGLNAVPKMILIKKLNNSSSDWVVYHEAITSANRLKLNTTDASASSPNWRATPTNTVFNSNSSNIINNSGDSYIAYCFAEKQGYSKFGSYVGNGSENGVFCFTGMKVGWLMIKRTDSANSWIIMDNKRTTFNPMGEELKAEVSDAGNDATRWDFLSNGFKLRNGSGAVNASGGSYIYMAFAENPFTTSSGVPATAR